MPVSRKRLSHVMRTVIVVAVVSVASYPVYRIFERPIRRLLGMPPPPQILLRFNAGEYDVRVVQTRPGKSYVNIVGRNGAWQHKVFDVAAYGFSKCGFIYASSSYAEVDAVLQGTPEFSKDINGDGWPEVILLDAHGTYVRSSKYHIIYPDGKKSDYYVLRLGKRIDCLLELPDTYLGGLRVLDEDKDGNPETLASDASWESGPGGTTTVNVPVVYKWQSGAYSVVAPAPYARYASVIEEKTRACLKEMERSGWTGSTDAVTSQQNPPVELWDVMLDYIYAGEGVKAREAFDRLWPGKMQGKDEALIKFDQFLRKGRFWNEINAVTAPEKRWPDVKAQGQATGN